MKIILNADDFGKNKEANEAIKYCFEKGYCTQASLMTSFGKATEDAVEMAKEYGFFDKIGCHINLREGAPMSEKIKNISAYVKDGVFLQASDAEDKMAEIYRFNPKYIAPLQDELRRQIEKFLSFEPSFMHCDFHHSVHCQIPIAIAMRPLLKEYGFQSARGRVYRHNFTKQWETFTGMVDHLFFWGKNVKKADISFNYDGFLRWGEKHPMEDKFVEIFSHPEMINGQCIDRYTRENKIIEETIGDVLAQYQNTPIVTYRDLVK
ncbi:MAG: ChbG/HpnK family deacetylase [Clostridia bacterium]|nr:ChbG/HpnK family deacetylase [Clostridia bacterium]